MTLLSLVDLDRELLVFLNSIHNHFFDTVMWLLSAKEIWIPLYLIIIYYFFNKVEKKTAIWVFLACVVCIVLCDQISSSIFKPLFERWRPSRDPILGDIVHIVHGKRGGKFGFVSSHAANVFGLTVFASMLFKNKWFTISMLFWAVIVSYSRIYLAVHFPGDVVCGGILGALCGLLMYKICNRYLKIDVYKKINLSYYYIVYAVIFISILACAKVM